MVNFKIKNQEVRKIALFRSLQLGDMLCALPAIRSWKRNFPKAHITLIGLPWAQQFCHRYARYLDAFISFPGFPGFPEQPFNVAAFPSFLHRVRNEHFDLIVQMHGSGVLSNSVVSLFGGKKTAGFFLPSFFRPNDTLFLQYPTGIHEIEKHLLLLRHLGLKANDTNLEFPITNEDQMELNRLQLELQPFQYVCVHPGSRSEARQWPPAYFAQLADYCAQRGLKVIITGTQTEVPLAKIVAAHMKMPATIIAGKTSIGSMAALLKNAMALICNCTGVSHLAAALATPNVVISMDGEPERWTPLNSQLHPATDWTRTQDLSAVLENLKNILARPALSIER